MLAQKIGLFAPVVVPVGQCTGMNMTGQIGYVLMDVGLISGLVMLVLWAVGTFLFDAPGWINLLLSVGVFVVIWRIVVRDTARTNRSSPK